MAFYLFFLSGGFAPLPFLLRLVQSIAVFITNTYGVEAPLTLAFYSTTQGLVQDFLVLGLASMITLALGSIAVRRVLD